MLSMFVLSYLAMFEQAPVATTPSSERITVRSTPRPRAALYAAAYGDGRGDAINRPHRSLAEGLDETQTLHSARGVRRAGAIAADDELSGVEADALVDERCAKVDHWQNSSQRLGWLDVRALGPRAAAADRMMPDEPSPSQTAREAWQRELKIDMTTSKKEAP